MQEEKGNKPSNWNWQMREHKTMEEIIEEQEYLKNVEDISHWDEKSGCESAKYNLNYNIAGSLSTKESSENSMDHAN